ncbi:reverse transcriptase domain, reverse transcriptase zinc-binding domain protein [Tanacetum coccineum]
MKDLKDKRGILQKMEDFEDSEDKLKCLGDIVSINQSAFVPGRRISDNILLAQELMRNYHRQRGPPRCAFKVDIQKAYTKIINLCFADDLFVFACGHPNSVLVIMDALEEFKQVFGLVPSLPKSTTFFCNVPNAIKSTILNSMPFAEGALPSVLSSMHIYWASVFILPNRIVHELEQLMHGFLWCQGEMKKGKAKVAWDSICMPKHEGGLDVCPLKDMLSNMDIARSGFSLDDSVSNLISDGVWRWPPDWDGVLRSFSVACVWDTIRSRADMQKLKTQDRLRQWDVGPSIDLNLLRCPLCDLVPDSHDHLFFECSFSSQVWSQVRALCGMDSIPPRLADVIAFIVPISKGKTVISIISRIVVAATSYYIWLERNGRLFKKKTSSLDQIIQVILSMVRLKLVTFKFKKMSIRSRLLLDQWKIPSYCISSFRMNQSLLCSSKFNHSKNGIGEIVLGEDKDKEDGKERDKNSPIECFEGIDGQWAEVINVGYDTQQTEVGSMEKLGDNGVKESGNKGVAMECNVGDKLVKFDDKDNDLVILNKLVQEVGRNMDMSNG